MSRILIVEDEDIIRNSLGKLLKKNNYETCLASNIKDALDQFKLSDFSLIISDLRLPGAPGTDLIKMAGDVPVLIMTSYASLRSAVDTMRMGAVDYISKPFDQDEMLATISRIFAKRGPAKVKLATPAATCGMVGSCEKMTKVFDFIGKVSKTEAPVLVYGETGTGKELVANAIHAQSERAASPIVSVNCASVSEDMIEVELFGQEQQSGDTETSIGLVDKADGGTLFLDEIGELSLSAQASLLSLLEAGEVRSMGSVVSRKVDVRLIAATHTPLDKLCKEGKFREDLFYRINVVNLDIPPLRERGDDILQITDCLVERFCKKLNKPPFQLAPETRQALTTYSWPGNIRELENAIQRAAILSEENQQVTEDLLGLHFSSDTTSSQQTPITPSSSPEQAPTENKVEEPPEGLSLEDYFTRFVIENQDAMSETELSRKLGISRKCLWERRQKLGIPRKRKLRSAYG